MLLFGIYKIFKKNPKNSLYIVNLSLSRSYQFCSKEAPTSHLDSELGKRSMRGKNINVIKSSMFVNKLSFN